MTGLTWTIAIAASLLATAPLTAADKQEDAAETVARGRDVRDQRSNAITDERVLERAQDKEEW